MRTAVVSDLHLSGLADVDVARRGRPLEALVEAVSDADRVVLLGDAVEMRERPLAQALEVAHPLFEALGRALAGRRVLLVPGNHDHLFAEPWLTRLRLDGERLGAGHEWPVGPDDGAAGRLAAWMPDVELTLAYPGVRLRPDVYATHGHYLDLHLTVPRLESIAASAMGRVTGNAGSPESAADYETIVAPMYAFYTGLAQGKSAKKLASGSNLSRTVWRRANSEGSPSVGRFLLGRVTIPSAVAALNGLGLGPFSSTLTGEELRRSGLLAMARVAETLAPGAEHVIFGHTHRPGPLARDDLAEWTTPSGTRLWNTGSWLHEGAFIQNHRDSPYWPGTVLTLEDEGPPRIENVLSGAGVA